MILQNKNAIIYGAGGSLGGAIAKAFASAGARVFLTRRSLPSVQKTAEEILSAGGKAEVDIVDALDKNAIQDHLEKVLQKAGTVGISFNAIGVEVKQNIPLVDLAADDFVRPVTVTLQLGCRLLYCGI